MKAYTLKDELDWTFCCLASQASDAYMVQKDHLPFKLFQSAENIKASVIFSYL